MSFDRRTLTPDDAGDGAALWTAQLPDITDQPVGALDRLDDVRSTSNRTDSSADNRMPCASVSIDTASSGSSVSVVRLRPAPDPGRA